MAAQFWLPSSGTLYLPPPTPITKVLSTDDFVTRTDTYYHAKSERLLMVGHPFWKIEKGGKLVAPKVSGNQYRVFRVSIPDPNKFALADPNIYNPERERLVWAVRGIEVGRGQPLGLGVTGHPYFNKLEDAENPITTYPEVGKENRRNVAFDPKQVQMLILGCTPCQGEHWTKALPCAEDVGEVEAGDCPPIELKTTDIQDGDMCDIGFGAVNFAELQETKSGVSLDIVQSTCKYPDFLKMTDDSYGNACFFYARREQVYLRHFWVRDGETGDDVPEEDYKSADVADRDSVAQAKKMGPVAYFGTPSGSLVSSDSQLFNRPYWLQRAQGLNNGICWGNQLFVTTVDNTRGTNFTISVAAKKNEHYEGTDFKQYLRHVEEYELGFIFQLCKVKLDPEVLAHLKAMSPSILEDWNLGIITAPGELEDKYRYIDSLATRCPKDNPPKEREDPYKNLNFWKVDLTQKFSLELEQHSLGRKFLFQAGIRNNKRPAAKSVSFKSTRPTKRRKKSN